MIRRVGPNGGTNKKTPDQRDPAFSLSKNERLLGSLLGLGLLAARLLLDDGLSR
jgi:hypothetical protein